MASESTTTQSVTSESSNITTTTTQSMISESSTTQDMGLDDAAPAQRMLKLISNDNKSFEVPVAFTNLSGLIATSLETDREAKELPLSGVNGRVLAKIVEFLLHHEGKEPATPEKPLRSKNMKEVCATHVWDADFVDAIWAEDKQLMYDIQMVSLSLFLSLSLSLSLCACLTVCVYREPTTCRSRVCSKSAVPRLPLQSRVCPSPRSRPRSLPLARLRRRLSSGTNQINSAIGFKC